MEHVIAGVIVLAVIIFFIVWAVKDKKRLEGYVSALSEEQKEILKSTEVQGVEGKENVWTQTGLICEVNVKNEHKVALVVLWYNKVIQNATFDKICHADINVKKEEFDSHGLKKGDFVKIYIDPEKGGKIVFD